MRHWLHEGEYFKLVTARRLEPLNPTKGESGRQGAPLQRISIVGSTGSGKTVFANALADRLGLPVHELDDVRSRSMRDGLNGQSFADRVAELTNSQSWIIDGHYRDVRDAIWARADAIVWLNYPLSLVAFRLLRRFTRKAREVSPPAAKNGHVASHPAPWVSRLKRLTRTLRERSEYSHLLSTLESQKLRVVELRSPSAAQRWLDGL